MIAHYESVSKYLVVLLFFGDVMRHSYIILLLTFGLFEKAFSDAGNCVKYDVDIQLTSGQKIRGFVYAGSYETKFQFQDISFLDYLNKIIRSDTLYVFKNIRQLKFPTTNYGREKCEFHFDAADESMRIPKKEIKEAKVVSYTVCNNCDVADEKEGYYWNGIYPTVITELNKTEIDLLQTRPLATIAFGNGQSDSADEYWMISYSQEYKQADLEKLKNDFLVEAGKLMRERKWDAVQAEYKALKDKLRKKKVVLFKIGFAI